MAASGAARAQSNGIFYGTSYGMKCDGKISDDDTAALNQTLSAAATNGGGVIVLPAGDCEFNTAPSGQTSQGQKAGIIVPGYVTLLIEGAGEQNTRLQWHQPGNFIDVGLSSYSSVTIQDLSIYRAANSVPSGSLFSGTALALHSGDNNHFFAGKALVQNVSILGDNNDGWQVGLMMGDLAGSNVDTVTVVNPSFAGSLSGLPTPTSPGQTPSNLGPGVADDILIAGLPNTGSNNKGDYASDTTLTNVSTNGGLVGLDAEDFQGIYVAGSQFLYSAYGIRSEDAANDANVPELVNVTGSNLNDNVADLYLVNTPNSEISNNLMFHNSSSGPFWAGVWANNSGESTFDGNSITGMGGNTNFPEYGVYISGSGSAAGYPVSITGNTIDYVKGPAISNDANSTGLTVTGNSQVGSQSASSDPTGQNYYTGNNFASSGPSTRPTSVSVGGNSNHATKTFSIWAYAQTTFVLTTDGTTPSATNQLSPVPNTATTGTIMVVGDVVCSNGNSHATWHYAGTWSWAPSTLTLLNFQPVSSDGQTGNPSGLTLQGLSDQGNSVPQISVKGASGNFDCTGTAAETFNQ